MAEKTNKLTTAFAVRAMTQADVPQVERIESVGSAKPWTAQMLTEYGGCGHTACLVVGKHQTTQVSGWLGYVPMNHTIHVSRVVVDPLWRRKGLGSLLFDALLTRHELLNDPRPVECFVPQNETDACIFLGKVGFRAVTLYRRPNTEAAYRFAWDGTEGL